MSLINFKGDRECGPRMIKYCICFAKYKAHWIYLLKNNGEKASRSLKNGGNIT